MISITSPYGWFLFQIDKDEYPYDKLPGLSMAGYALNHMPAA